MPSLTKFQNQVCIGSLLGDMSASKPKDGQNYHLSCYHSQKQLNWLQIKWGWLQPYSRPIQFCAYLDKRDDKIRKGGRFHTRSTENFSQIAKYFYVNGIKIIPININKLFYHPVALAILICDDGSWDKAGIQIASKQFTQKENNRLAKTIKENFGINAYVVAGRKYFNIRISAQSVTKTFNLCKKFIPQTMYYKFGGEEYSTYLTGKIKTICPICKKEFLSYKSAEKRYCSPQCSGIGKPKGYRTRHKKGKCIRCGSVITIYSRKHQRCPLCHGLRVKPLPCVICGKPVIKIKHHTCSMSCNVSLGHKSRKPFQVSM